VSLLALIVAACGGDDGAASQPNPVTPTIVSLQVTPAQGHIPLGFEQQFIAQATMSDGTVKDVTADARLSWGSSNDAIVTIDDKGLAKGVMPGDVTITASGVTISGSTVSATAKLEVTSAVVTQLQVTPAVSTVPAGFETQFTATAYLSDGSALDVTTFTGLSWSSSNTAIATIDSAERKGMATGVAVGTATITASGAANGTPFSATAELTVSNATVTALQVTPATASVPAGLEQQFEATATLSDGTTRDVTQNSLLSWTSSDLDIAHIDRKGMVKGVAVGTVTITASGAANGTPFSATAELTVTNAELASFIISPSSVSIPIGGVAQLAGLAVMTDRSFRNITNDAAFSWSSSNTSIVTVSSLNGDKGLVTSVATGTAIITLSGAIDGNPVSATSEVIVFENAVVSPRGCTRNQVALGNSFYLCPLLKSEADAADISYIDTVIDGGREFARMDHARATEYCGALGNGYRVPEKSELSNLYNANGNMATYAGWPMVGSNNSNYYVSNTSAGGDTHSTVRMDTGAVWRSYPDQGYYASCMYDGSQTVLLTSASAITVGSIVQMNATYKGQNVTSSVIAWQSADPGIVSINATGLMTGISIGVTTIEALVDIDGRLIYISVQVAVEAINLAQGCTTDVVVGDKTFTCPLLQSEAHKFGIPYTIHIDDGHGVFVAMTLKQSQDYCSRFGPAYRLPLESELSELYAAYGNMQVYGNWPTSYAFATSSLAPGSLSLVSNVRLDSGQVTASGFGAAVAASCVSSPTSSIPSAVSAMIPFADVGVAGSSSLDVTPVIILSNTGILIGGVSSNFATDNVNVIAIDAAVKLFTGLSEGSANITGDVAYNGVTYQTENLVSVVPLPNFGLGCTNGTMRADGLEFTCPMLKDEADARGIFYQTTYDIGTVTYVGASESFCNSLGYGYRLPTIDELVLLYGAHGDLSLSGGWPVERYYLGEPNAAGNNTVDLSTGVAYTIPGNISYISCVRPAL
jgi:uncharacterized protein YjdB